jgi:hypothetical protein
MFPRSFDDAAAAGYIVVDTTNNLVGSFDRGPTRSDLEDVQLGLVMLIRRNDFTFYDRKTGKWLPIPTAELERADEREPRHQPPFR